MKNKNILSLLMITIMALASAPALAGGDAKKGEALYKKKCKFCHSIKAGKHKKGPSLAGVFGTNAASKDFPKYLGLKNKTNVIWNDANLDAFLANPKKFVGARTMAAKLKKTDDRNNIIEYLKTLK